MGCCHSVPEERTQNSTNTNNNNAPVATIVVTKAPSISYENDAEPSHIVDSLPPNIGEPLHITTEPEKVPVTATEPDHSTLKTDIPAITITTTTPEPEPEPESESESEPEPELEPESPKTPAVAAISSPPAIAIVENKQDEEKKQVNNNNSKLENEQGEQGKGSWSVTVRLSNTGKDITISIPTEAPFMSITELRQHIQPYLQPDQQVKLIHLGHILKDRSKLVPSTNLLNSTDDTVPVSNQGVIQAMVYNPHSI